MSDTSIGKGLADPVLETQTAFRRVLWAMSHPGDIVDLAGTAEMPQAMPPAVGLMLLTLADPDTPVWLPPAVRPAWSRWLAFHTGAPATTEGARAAFAVVLAQDPAPLLTEFGCGDERYPDRSTTVIAICAALAGGMGDEPWLGAPGARRVVLAGPGIETTRTIAPRGVPAAFWQACIANHERYPLGVDIVLAAGSRMLALPRSVSIAVTETG